LFDLFRGSMPNLEAVWQILRRWPFGPEILHGLFDGGKLEEVDERHATFALKSGSNVTVYRNVTWRQDDGVPETGFTRLLQVLAAVRGH